MSFQNAGNFELKDVFICFVKIAFHKLLYLIVLDF